MNNYKRKITIVGFGNLLMGDDGVGIHVIGRLAASGLPPGVEAVDGGVASLEVLGLLARSARLIIVDAVNGPEPPGTIYKLAPEEILSAAQPWQLSLHQFSLAQSLACLADRYSLPPTAIYGIQPETIGPGLGLTPAVAGAAERLVRLLLDSLASECNKQPADGGNYQWILRL